MTGYLLRGNPVAFFERVIAWSGKLCFCRLRNRGITPPGFDSECLRRDDLCYWHEVPAPIQAVVHAIAKFHGAIR